MSVLICSAVRCRASATSFVAMGVKVGFRKKEKGCSGGTFVGCGPDGHVGHGGSVGRCIASGGFAEDGMDFMPGIIHITVLAPSKKNRSAVRAIITHQPF